MAPLAFTTPFIFSASAVSSSTTSFVSRHPITTPRNPLRVSPVRISTPRQSTRTLITSSVSLAGKRILVIGGTRFSGLYLVHELCNRGADVVILNRGSKPIGDPSLRVPGETEQQFADRNAKTHSLIADRTDPDALKAALEGQKFDVIFDNNGRELPDSQSLINMAKEMGTHYVYMSSAGVYLKSEVMPHIEDDSVDPKCRHKGKLNTEEYLRSTGINYTAIRPTYIYGALNYNPLDQWFFERLDKGMPICVPGHGAHLTGLGHVRDLASAMASCALNPTAYKQVYNVQDRSVITFDGVARMCAEVMGKPEPEIIHYNPSDMDFKKKKAFPFRPQHFFTSPNKALRELDWTIQYDLRAGLEDAYQNDFLIRKANGTLNNDFTTDEIILQAVKGTSAVS